MSVTRVFWEVIKGIAKGVGIVIGGLLMLFAFWGIVYSVIGLGFLLYTLAVYQPLLGIPLLVAVVCFCLWCAFLQKAAVTPTQTVLRGPFVVTSKEQRIQLHLQQGSGETQSDSHERVMPLSATAHTSARTIVTPPETNHLEGV